jgi:hypothetical protein
VSSEWGACQPQAKPMAFMRVVSANPKAVLPLRLAETLALKTSYGKLLVLAPDRTWFQQFACRDIAGSDSHSEHSHTIAYDIRPPGSTVATINGVSIAGSNPMRDDGIFITDFDRFGLEDGVAFVMSFIRAGFRWGANWMSPLDFSLAELEQAARFAFANKGKQIRDGRVDTMHVELELSPAQVAARDYAGEIEAALTEEEDEIMTLEELLEGTGIGVEGFGNALNILSGIHRRMGDSPIKDDEPLARKRGFAFADALMDVKAKLGA